MTSESVASVPSKDGGKTPPIDPLMRVTNERVEAYRQPGSNLYAGWLADLRAGIVPAGDPRAIRSAGAFIAHLTSDRARSGAIRAAAIRAVNWDVRHAELRLGQSFFWLSHREGGDSIAEQVETLPLLNQDAAALLLNGLVGRCASSQIPINFRELAANLKGWGEGGGLGIRDRRNRIIFDFYSVDKESLATWTNDDKENNPS